MSTRTVTVLDAPSNLGLRPTRQGTLPGCYKLPGALRDHGLVRRLNAQDAGCATPPMYDWGDYRAGDGVFNARQIAKYSRQLADRIESTAAPTAMPLVLGGDCSILLGSALAMRRRGRYGLVFLDAHTDFRHPGNSQNIGAAAGEDLALATGRGQEDLTNIDGLRPYVIDQDVLLVGVRDDAGFLDEALAAGMSVITASTVQEQGIQPLGDAIQRFEEGPTQGYWVHVDADVLDRRDMPAVDCPESNGLDFNQLGHVLKTVTSTPACVGVHVTVFDPDLDENGTIAARLTETLVDALGEDQ